MEYLDLYKELYHKENDRRGEIQNSLNIPIAVLTALSTVTYYFMITFDYRVETFLNFIFITIVSLTIACILISVYHLVRAFTEFTFTRSYEYTGLPYTKELYDWYEQLKEHFQVHGTDGDARTHFNEYLEKSFVEHVDHNMFVNDQKSRFIFQSKRWMVFALILTLISTVPFGYNFFNKAEKIPKMIILTPREDLKRKDSKMLLETKDTSRRTTNKIKEN